MRAVMWSLWGLLTVSIAVGADDGGLVKRVVEGGHAEGLAPLAPERAGAYA